MLAARQGIDIGNEIAVVVHIKKQLAVFAVFLRLAVAMAHGETYRSAVGLYLERQETVLRFNVVDDGDDANKIAPRQRLLQQSAVLGRPVGEITQQADFVLLTVIVGIAKTDELIGEGCRQSANGEEAIVESIADRRLQRIALAALQARLFRRQPAQGKLLVPTLRVGTHVGTLCVRS